jgi:hypothetical protein
MVIGLLGVGLITLVAGALWAHDHAVPWVDAAMSVSGGVVLAAGHIRNLLICRQS